MRKVHFERLRSVIEKTGITLYKCGLKDLWRDN